MTVEGLLATINQDRFGSVLKFLQTNLMVLTIAGLVCLVVDKSNTSSSSRYSFLTMLILTSFHIYFIFVV